MTPIRCSTLLAVLVGIATSHCSKDVQENNTGTESASDADNNAGAEPASDADTVGEPYADVTGVAVSGEPSAYELSVTVSSPDIDCTQYAAWWEVLSEEGELLYRRILTHSHTDANGNGNPFTRSGGPVEMASDQTVIVRAHMNTGGYGGVVMSGSVDEGFAIATDIEPSFAATVESVDPQPDGCAF